MFLHNITNMEHENNLYQTLFKLHVNAYPLKSKQVCQAEVTKMWNEIKNKDNFEISDKHRYLNYSYVKKGSILKFWSK